MSSFLEFWSQHFPIFSILVPAFTAFTLIILGNPGAGALSRDWRQPIRHAISWGSGIIGLILAIAMVNYASSDQIMGYSLGDWSAPFGIVLVVDRLAAMMVLLTYVTALPILWFASAYWDQKGRYFHTMFHFLLMGLCGAFLTGDLFNLFVFFEILLMASYVLLLHSHNKARFSVGVHYVTINLFASALFLVGLGLIYGSVGSLNMADVARIYPTLNTDNHQLALAGAMLLFVVFGIKAAMIPVGFWLPKTYAVATTPVAAIFALMTKVGIYAILRINGTIFSDAQGQYLLETWLLGIGILTTVYGVIGAIGAERLRRFIGFMVLSSIGTILIAIALFTQQTWAAGLYYLVHSTLIAACFYLLAEWITLQRGSVKDHFKTAPRIKQHTLVSLIFLVIALMLAGLPPFSGFIGKVLLLQGTLYHPWQLGIVAVILLVSILSILALVRVGFILFWRASTPDDDPNEQACRDYQVLPDQSPPRLNKVIYIFLAILLAYAVCADPIYRYTYAAAEQLFDKTRYQDVLLKKDAGQQVISTLPFDPYYLPQLKYATPTADPYVPYIPYIVSEATLSGQHISEENKQLGLLIHPDHEHQKDEKVIPAENLP